jgi:hypothetical protein
MTKYFVSLMLLTLSACGPVPTGGQDGIDGRSPKCSIDKRTDGKTYLKCINPDGSAAEAEIASEDDGNEPPAPEAEFSSLASCEFNSESETARFNVLAFGETHKISSLSVLNKKTSQVFYQSTLIHALGEPSFASAEVRLSAYSAKLIAEKAAELSKVTGEKWRMTCI